MYLFHPCSLTDIGGLERQALEGAKMGFTGKQVIHPGQVAAVQRAFLPSVARQDWATQLITAFEEHQQSGQASVTRAARRSASLVYSTNLLFIIKPLLRRIKENGFVMPCWGKQVSHTRQGVQHLSCTIPISVIWHCDRMWNTVCNVSLVLSRRKMYVDNNTVYYYTENIINYVSTCWLYTIGLKTLCNLYGCM